MRITHFVLVIPRKQETLSRTHAVYKESQRTHPYINFSFSCVPRAKPQKNATDHTNGTVGATWWVAQRTFMSSMGAGLYCVRERLAMILE